MQSVMESVDENGAVHELGETKPFSTFKATQSGIS